MGSGVLYATLGVLVTAVIANWLLTLAIVRRVTTIADGRRTIPRSGLKEGEAAPDFSATRLDGAHVTLEDFSSRRTIMVFINPGCKACEESIPDYVRLASLAWRRGEQLLLVSGGDLKQTREMLGDRNGALSVITAPQQANTMFTDFKINATPYFTVLKGRRVMGSGMAWMTVPGWKELNTDTGIESRDPEARLP